MHREKIDIILNDVKAKLSYIDEVKYVEDPLDYLTEFKGNLLLGYLKQGEVYPIDFNATSLSCPKQYTTSIRVSLLFVYDSTFDNENVLNNFIHVLGEELLGANPITSEVYLELTGEEIPSSDYKLMKIDLLTNDIFTPENCIVDVC